MRGAGLRPLLRVYLHDLASYMDADGSNCFPGARQLADDLNVKRDTIFVLQKEAVAAGWLIVQSKKGRGRNGGQGLTNRYLPSIPGETQQSGDRQTVEVSDGETQQSGDHQTVEVCEGETNSQVSTETNRQVVGETKSRVSARRNQTRDQTKDQTKDQAASEVGEAPSAVVRSEASAGRRCVCPFRLDRCACPAPSRQEA